jgi:hypothetical protein
MPAAFVVEVVVVFIMPPGNTSMHFVWSKLLHFAEQLAKVSVCIQHLCALFKQHPVLRQSALSIEQLTGFGPQPCKVKAKPTAAAIAAAAATCCAIVQM